MPFITGTQPFGPLELLTRPPVLIPRPETEDWTLRLSRRLSPSKDSPARLLDLCTGSGCIPLLLCHLWPPGSVRAIGVDISQDALSLAHDNARATDVQLATADDSAEGENTFTPLFGDIGDPISLAHRLPLRPYTLVTANPPYIPSRDYASLDPSVRLFEDKRALVGPGEDGLGLYRAIAEFIKIDGVLDRCGATIAVEVGKGQASAVQDIIHATRLFAKTEIWTDPWDVERVVVGTTVELV